MKKKLISIILMSFLILSASNVSAVQYGDISEDSVYYDAINVLSDDNSFMIVNEKTGMSVKVNFDVPVNSFFLWSWQKAFCPEPKILIDIMPNESFEWNCIYEFNVK